MNKSTRFTVTCLSIFCRYSTILLHSRAKHPRKMMSSSKASAIRRHRETISQFKCGQCKEYSGNKNAWMYHMKGYHAEIKENFFECYFYRRILSDKGSLKEHIMNVRHSRQRSFKCQVSDVSNYMLHEILAAATYTRQNTARKLWFRRKRNNWRTSTNKRIAISQ